MSAGDDEWKVELSGEHLERGVMVGSDLEYLKTLPTDRLLTHTEVRLVASVLRRLLIDHQIHRFWGLFRRVGAPQLPVRATFIDDALDQWPESWIRYAWAGGATPPGASHRGFVLGLVPREAWWGYGSPEAFFRARPLPLESEDRDMTLDTWLRTTSAAIQTNEAGLVRISRAAVLKYIANRKGGIHFDPNRQLPRSTAPRRSAKRNRPDRRARELAETKLLDHGLLRVGHLSGPEFEVCSMAHVLAQAVWCDQLIQSAREASPEDFDGDPYELKAWTGLREADGTGWATWRVEPSNAAEPDP